MCVCSGRRLSREFKDQDEGFLTPKKGGSSKPPVAPNAPQREKKHELDTKHNNLEPFALAETLNLFSNNPRGVRRFPEESRFAFDECFDFVHLFKAKHTIELFLLGRGDSELKEGKHTGIFVRALLRQLPDVIGGPCYVDWLDRWTGELWKPKEGLVPEIGQIDFGKEVFGWRVREQFTDHSLHVFADAEIEKMAIDAFLCKPGKKKVKPSDLLQSAHDKGVLYCVDWKKVPPSDLGERYIKALAEVDMRVKESIGVFPHGTCMVSVCGWCHRVDEYDSPDGSCSQCGVSNIGSECELRVAVCQHISKDLTDSAVRQWKNKEPLVAKPLDLSLVYHARDVLCLREPFYGTNNLVVVLEVTKDNKIIAFGPAGDGKFAVPEELPVKWTNTPKWLGQLHACSSVRVCGCFYSSKDTLHCAFGHYADCSNIMGCGCVFEEGKIHIWKPNPVCVGCNADAKHKCTCNYTIWIYYGNNRRQMTVNSTMLIKDVHAAACEYFPVEFKESHLVGNGKPFSAGDVELGAAYYRMVHFELINKPVNSKKRKADEEEKDGKSEKKHKVDVFVPETPPRASTPALAQPSIEHFDFKFDYQACRDLCVRLPVGCELKTALQKCCQTVELSTIDARLYCQRSDLGRTKVLTSAWERLTRGGNVEGKWTLTIKD